MNPIAGAAPGPWPGNIEAPDATGFSIRAARPEDAEILVNLVRELAVYSKLDQYVQATPDDFRRHLFGPGPAAEAALADVRGETVGFAIWYAAFSTFRGQPGLYVEDIFVRPSHRGRGVGKGLLAAVARRAGERACGWLGWSVLDWNTPAIGFYRALGARPMDDATVYRLDDEPLRRLAAMAAQPSPPSA
jgi:GNAT superfamily N-acetyltransferase